MIKIEEPIIETHKSFISYKKRTDKTKYIVVHCSATQPKSSYDWKTIDQMHRQQGWLGIGYHYVIKTDGTIQEGRPLDTIGSHVKGHNNDSVGICLIGGIDRKGVSANNFTSKQMESLRCLIDYLRSVYNDEVTVLGHRDFEGVRKDCPCFDVRSWYSENHARYAKFSTENENFLFEMGISKVDFEKYNGSIKKIKEGELVYLGMASDKTYTSR